MLGAAPRFNEIGFTPVSSFRRIGLCFCSILVVVFLPKQASKGARRARAPVHHHFINFELLKAQRVRVGRVQCPGKFIHVHHHAAASASAAAATSSLSCVSLCVVTNVSHVMRTRDAYTFACALRSACLGCGSFGAVVAVVVGLFAKGVVVHI